MEDLIGVKHALATLQSYLEGRGVEDVVKTERREAGG